MGPGGGAAAALNLRGASLNREGGQVQVPGRAVFTCACSAPWGDGARGSAPGNAVEIPALKGGSRRRPKRPAIAQRRPPRLPPRRAHLQLPGPGGHCGSETPPPSVLARAKPGASPALGVSTRLHELVGLLMFLRSFIMNIVHQESRENNSRSTRGHTS